MPVNNPPEPKDWGPVAYPANQTGSWGNLGYLDANHGEGAVLAVMPTSDGGVVWMQGGFGNQFWRLFSDGSLHRYTLQADGMLREYRVETLNGEIIYTSPDPFSGSTAGDAAMRSMRTGKPFHITQQATIPLPGGNYNWKTCAVTWYYDDTGGVSFGVLEDGSRVVYEMNLTPDGPVPRNATHNVGSTRSGFNLMPLEIAVVYDGNVFPKSPVIEGFGSRWAFAERSFPYYIPAEYFTNKVVTDEKIKSLPGSGLAIIYYMILHAKMFGNCPHYLPTKDISNGMSEAQAFCNEMDIRMRIYNLRPDLHFTTGPKGEKIVGLVDPLIIPIYNGMKCKESIWATVGLAVALGLFTAGVGAILPVLGTLTELAQMGNAVANMFAAQEGVQRALELKNEISGGIAGILKETKLIIPTPTVTKTPDPVTGTVASAPSSSSKSLAIPAVLLLLLLL
jgi:hypothetical protein